MAIAALRLLTTRAVHNWNVVSQAMAPADLIGKPAPDMKVTSLNADGFVVRTSLLASRRPGQAMVVDFVAPWCGSCPAAATRLDALANGDLADKCAVVLLCVDGGIGDAKKIADAHGIKACTVASVDEEDVLE